MSALLSATGRNLTTDDTDEHLIMLINAGAQGNKCLLCVRSVHRREWIRRERRRMKINMGANSLLFVYGTLKRGEENHRWLAVHHPRFLCEARIQGRLFRIKGESYPGAAPTSSRRYVRGELYELARPDQALQKLDKFEGTDEGLFVRKLADVWIGSRKMKAWTYFYPGRSDKAAPVPGGSFRARSNSRARSTRQKAAD